MEKDAFVLLVIGYLAAGAVGGAAAEILRTPNYRPTRDQLWKAAALPSIFWPVLLVLVPLCSAGVGVVESVADASWYGRFKAWLSEPVCGRR